MGPVINQSAFNRISGYIETARKEGMIAFGGNYDDSKGFYIEPTVVRDITKDAVIAKEEIFGPVLPILTYDSINEAVNNIRAMSHPLALYIFAGDTHVAENVIARIGFGGGCINDTLIHLATSEMPFGGLAKVAWAVTTERPDLIHLHITKVLWIRRPGWICQCDISLTRR